MRWLSALLLATVLPVVLPAVADDPDGPKRSTVSFRAGGFDAMGTDLMLRREGEGFNAQVGWKGSGQVGLAFGYEVRPGVTLELSYVDLDYDFGADLLAMESPSAQIATGNLENYRIAAVFDAQLFADAPAYRISPEREQKGRLALIVIGTVTDPDEVVLADPGRQLLGVEDVEADTQTAAGLGMRLDYRLGGSALTLGADLCWTWKVNGDLFTVSTAPDSPFAGTTAEHEGLDFLLDVSYHF